MTRWQRSLPIMAAVLALICFSTAGAQSDSSPTTERYAELLPAEFFTAQADYRHTTSYQEDDEQRPSPLDGEPEEARAPEDPSAPPAPLPEDASEAVEPASPVAEPEETDGEPSDVVPLPPPDEAYGQPPESPFIPLPDLEDEAAESAAGRTPRGAACCPTGSCSSTACDGCCGGCCGIWGGLSDPRRSVVLGGWVDQGITTNGYSTPDRFNGPVTFNDRDGEYQCNQVWVYAEKAVDTGGYGWDIGGRIDFMYGTDWRFTQALGLEDRWNTERFYGAAMPQLYADVAVGNLSVRMGHFFTVIGYEVVQAPDNFFYSHTYTMQYGEPFTHTGLLASYALGDQWTISAGFGRGWDNWEDNNNELEFLGSVSWTSYDEDTSLALAVTSGEFDEAGENTRTMYSIVFAHQATDRLQYVFQHDWGMDDNGGPPRITGGHQDAEWYGINQYLLYDINRYWGLGVRMEWFRDDDGVRVGGLGAPHGWTLGPNIPGGQVGWAGNFYELAIALNWKPTRNINLRPECRWDWYAGPPDGAGWQPYNFGGNSTQFTFATDLIISF